MKKRYIFIAEDDADDRLLFDAAFQGLSCANGCHLTFAENGQGLLELIKTTSSPPHIIFLDLNMPIMNGLECLKELRQIYSPDALPVILLSTSNNARNIADAYELGASKYIQKPNDFDELVKVLDHCLCREELAKGKLPM